MEEWSMDKSCTGCKEYIAHQYWHHMDNREKRFFKPMIGDFRNGLTIPQKFVRNAGGLISEVVKLETADGNTHDVQVSKELNNLVLRSGWARFASIYELEEGDFLVFRYSGDSHFKIEIYDPSACEKELSCVVTNCISCLQKRSIPDDNPIWSPEDERLAKCHNGGCSHNWRTSKMNPAGSPPQTPTEKGVPPSEGIQDPMNFGELQRSTRFCYVLATGCNLTEAHKAEVENIEQNSRSEIPLYVKTMDTTSLVDGFLDYAIKYLPHKDQNITLCHANHSKTWNAHFTIQNDGTYILSASWLGFVGDNELQAGDTCVFEVSKSENGVTMTVHLLKTSHHAPGFVPSAKSFKPEDYVKFSRTTALEGLLKTKVYAKVEAIKPEILIFVAVMQKSNIGHRSAILAFSQDYARDYLPDKNQIARLRRSGESTRWKVSYRILKGRRCLVGGWGRFIDDNKLKLGDVCLFELMKNRKNLRMRVHIIGKEGYC